MNCREEPRFPDEIQVYPASANWVAKTEKREVSTCMQGDIMMVEWLYDWLQILFSSGVDLSQFASIYNVCQSNPFAGKSRTKREE